MNFRTLSMPLEVKAFTEFKETPELIQESLKSIQEWATQQHLIMRADKQWLLNVLRSCKYDMETAKAKLELMCTLKTMIPDFFKNRDPFLPEITNILDLGICLPLLKTSDPAAPRVILLRANSLDPEKHRIEDVIKLILMIVDILLNEDDNCIISGAYLLIDTKEITMVHLMQIQRIAEKFYKCMRNGFALRPQGFHVINSPNYFEAVFSILKSKYCDELLNMVHFYDEYNIDTLYKTIPPFILPEEYNGNGGSISEITREWKNKVQSYRDWFLDDAQYSDEAKRPQDMKMTTSQLKSTNFMDINELD